MVAAGTGILATVAGIDDVAEALAHVDHVNADKLLGAGVSFIIAGTGHLIKMLLSGRDFAKVKDAVDKNTKAVNGMKSSLTKMIGDMSSMKKDMSSMKKDMSSMKKDMSSMKKDMSSMKKDMSSIKSDIREVKTGIGTLIALNERMATAIEGLSSNVGDLVDELRRGARPPARP